MTGSIIALGEQWRYQHQRFIERNAISGRSRPGAPCDKILHSVTNGFHDHADTAMHAVMHRTPETVPECLVLAEMLESYLAVENGGWVDERDVHLIRSLVRGLEGLASKGGAS